jgi:hypothetical protein
VNDRDSFNAHLEQQLINSLQGLGTDLGLIIVGVLP